MTARKDPKDYKKKGRPTKYTSAVAVKICSQLAMGKSMRTVCADPLIPSMQTVFSWLRDRPEFLEQYTRAKEEAADAFVEEMQDISDDGSNDWMEINIYNGKGKVIGTKTVLNHEHVQRSKLRVDTRKWIVSKLKPKKYGDKLDLTSAGEALAAPITGMKISIEKDK